MKKIILTAVIFLLFIVSCSSDYTKPYQEANSLYENKNYDESLKKYKEYIGYNIVNNEKLFDSYIKIAEIYARKGRLDIYQFYINGVRNHILAIEDKEIRKTYLLKINKISNSIVTAQRENKKIKDTNKIEKIYQTAIGFYNKKDYISAYKNLKLIEDTNYKDTLKILNEIEEEVNNTLDNMFKEGFNLYTNGEYKEALKVFDKILSINPDYKEALYYRENSIKKIKVLESM